MTIKCHIFIIQTASVLAFDICVLTGHFCVLHLSKLAASGEQACVFTQNRSSRPLDWKNTTRVHVYQDLRHGGRPESRSSAAFKWLTPLGFKEQTDARPALCYSPASQRINSEPMTFLISLRNTQLHIKKLTVNQHNKTVGCTKQLLLNFTGTMSRVTIWRTPRCESLSAPMKWKVVHKGKPTMVVSGDVTNRKTQDGTRTALWVIKILVSTSVMSKPHETAWRVRARTVWNIHKKYKIIYQTFLAPRYVQLQMQQSAHHVWKFTQKPDGKTQRSHSITELNK